MRYRLLFVALAAGALSPNAELRVPAHTAYLVPDPDAVRLSPNRPVLPFARPGAGIAWFGQLKATGVLSAAVTLKLPPDASVTLRLTVGGEYHDATAAGGETGNAGVVRHVLHR